MRASMPRRVRGIAHRALVGGYPTPETIRAAHRDAVLTRAITAYRFFYPTVSGAALFRGNEAVGIVDNRVFGMLDARPHHAGFTFDSDMPYGRVQLNLRDGPIVVALPAGPLVTSAIDINQRWVADMGLAGPDAGKGGRHVILPPDHHGEVPSGHHLWHSPTFRVLVSARALPLDGDFHGAMSLIRSIEVRPAAPPPDWTEPRWLDLTSIPHDMSPFRLETDIGFWRLLHEVVDGEPPLSEYHAFYGELAALGIEKGKPFEPDEQLRALLTEAARLGRVQMCVQAFADRRPDRVVWPDRRWEWVALRPGNGDFDAESHADLVAREVWFHQAIGASPAQFRRQPGSGSLCWIAARDADGEYLDGRHHYRLTVPLPVPATHFWSVTVYDAETRSQIQTDQERAALRSHSELKDASGRAVELHFGPDSPAAGRTWWVRTIPGRGWFTYLRVYGPEQGAFDGSWRPGELERVR